MKSVIEPFDNNIIKLREIAIIINDETKFNKYNKILLFISDLDNILKSNINVNNENYYIKIMENYKKYDYKVYCITDNNKQIINKYLNKISKCNFNDIVVYNCCEYIIDFNIKNFKNILIINENLKNNDNIELKNKINICIINNILLNDNYIKSEKIFSYYLLNCFDKPINEIVDNITLKISKFNRNIILYNKCNRKYLYV